MAKKEIDFEIITPLTIIAGASADTEITLLKVKAEEYMATQHAGYPKAMLNNIFDLVFELVGHRANGRISLANDAFKAIEEELLQLRQFQKAKPEKAACYQDMSSFVDVAMRLAMEETQEYNRLEKIGKLSEIKKLAIAAEGIKINW